MFHIADQIMRILHECHPNKDEFENKIKDSNDSKESEKNIRKERGKLEKIKNNGEKCFTDTRCNYIASIEYASLNKMLALCNLEVIESFIFHCVAKDNRSKNYKICMYNYYIVTITAKDICNNLI